MARENQVPQRGKLAGGEETIRCGSNVAIFLLLVIAALLRLWYASYQLDEGRFWDERYSLRNVASFLEQGRPNRALYPSLSFLPHAVVFAASEQLHSLTGDSRFAIYSNREKQSFSSTGYLLGRLVSILFGVWSIWLTYTLGLRLFGDEVGLLAAIFLTTYWRHVMASAEFKPDSVALAFILVAFRWSLDAIHSPSWKSFLLAGVGVGLATSAKHNAAGISIALVVGVLVSDWKCLRLWRGLALAGVSSLLTFFLLNPWWSLVWSDFNWQLKYYERVAQRIHSSHFHVLLKEGKFLLRHHGEFVTCFVVLGTLALLFLILRRRVKTRGPAMLVGFFLGYSALYAAVTKLFLSQNYLLVVPFTSLIAAWAMLESWSILGRYVPLLALPVVHWGAWCAVVFLCFRFPISTTYETVVPTTTKVAGERLAKFLRPTLGHLVIYENIGEPLRVVRAGHWVPTLAFESLQEVETHRLDVADAELFEASRLESAEGDFYQQRLAREQVVDVQRIAPQWLHARGPSQVLILHPWFRRGAPEHLGFHRLEGESRDVTSLEGFLRPGEIFSLEFVVPHVEEESFNKVERFQFGSRTEIMYRTRKGQRKTHFSSQRLQFEEGQHELKLLVERKEGDRVARGKIYRWSSAKDGAR